VWQSLLPKEDDATDKPRPIGFAKYGLELWWLAQRILELSKGGGDTDKDNKSRYMMSRPTDCLEELHDFIQRYAEGQCV
jgi:hypothetical protein